MSLNESRIGHIQGEPKVVYFSTAIGKFNIEIVGFLGKVLLVHPIYKLVKQIQDDNYFRNRKEMKCNR